MNRLNYSSVNLTLFCFVLNSWISWNIFMTTNTSMLTLRLPISYWDTGTQTRLVNFCLMANKKSLIKEMLHCMDF